MNIYIDTDYICHTQNDGTRRAFDVPFFDGKCRAFVEGYRYVPDGETWTRWDGVEFTGEMIAPCKPYEGLEEAQNSYVDGRDKVIDAVGEIIDGSTDFTANNNYDLGSLLMIDGEAYETIKAIPRGKTIHINEDVVKTTITKFMEEKE